MSLILLLNWGDDVRRHKQTKLTLTDKRGKWRSIARQVCKTEDGVYSGNVFYWCEEKSGYRPDYDDKDWIIADLVKSSLVYYNNRFFHPNSKVLKEAIRVTKLMRERGEIE